MKLFKVLKLYHIPAKLHFDIQLFVSRAIQTKMYDTSFKTYFVPKN